MDAEVTADVTAALVCAVAALVPPDRHPDATSATATTRATFHFMAAASLCRRTGKTSKRP
jgi:hypothetical protein